MNDKDLLTKENYNLLLKLQKAFANAACEINHNALFSNKQQFIYNDGVTFTQEGVLFAKAGKVFSCIPIEFLIDDTKLKKYIQERIKYLENNMKGTIINNSLKENIEDV
ncbi:hypothetical protein CMI47_12945 [Candidatus Pacearchaeota archaeon]|nr:hypothetical protein [Candidatus Pacearchaeota archaeon]|tara:strand:+ start:35541 stop:35867 length:327 start_codon:yes stop_codon:yes gene_type:complete